jgi:molybdate transport system ATP-binding protein
MSRLVAKFDVEFPKFHLQTDMDVPAAGITAVFGHSGSGKTTLLRCLAGLERSRTGYMRLGEEVWQDETAGIYLPIHTRPIGYVFQEPRLFPHLSVKSNLLYGYHRTPAAARRIAPERVIDILGIGEILDRRPHKLSGGEQQRVAIGRALLTSPRLLLLDEPLASLDIKRKREILPFIRRLHNQLKVPIVYVSHAITEILQLADIVAFLKEGKLVATGPLSEVFSSLDPGGGHLGRARIGAVLDVQVAGHEPDVGLTRLEFKGQDLYAPLQRHNRGDCVRVHILASDVSITLGPPASPTSVLNILAATVMEIRDIDDFQVDVRLDIGAPLIASITRKSVSNLHLKPGQVVHAHIKSVALNEELTE